MKTIENKLTLLIIILVSLLIGMSINWIFNSKVALVNGKQLIKEMTEGEYESKLTELNKSHEDYNKQVQANKKKLATAISSQKVATSENATIDEMVTNIGKILQVGTLTLKDTISMLNGSIAYDVDKNYETMYLFISLTTAGSHAGKDYVPTIAGCTATLISKVYNSKTLDGVNLGGCNYVFKISDVAANTTITIQDGRGSYYGLGLCSIFVA